MIKLGKVTVATQGFIDGLPPRESVDLTKFVYPKQ